MKNRRRGKGSKYRQKQSRQTRIRNNTQDPKPGIIRPRKLSDKDMAKRFDSEFGDKYTLNYLQKIAFPYYKVKLSVISAGKPEKDIKKVYDILLRLVKEEVNTEEKIIKFLGLRPPHFILQELYELARQGVVYPDKEGNYKLSSQGRDILKKNAWFKITQIEEIEFVIDGITGKIQDSREFFPNENEKQFEGIFDVKQPGFSWLTDHWTAICQMYQHTSPEKELVDFANNKQSIIWSKLFYEDQFVFGFTEKENPEAEMQWRIRDLMEKELPDKVKVVKELLENQLTVFYDEDIVDLSLHYQEKLEKGREEVQEEIVQSAPDNYTELANFEIRDAMMKAIESANTAILIESPWIRKATERLLPELEIFLKKGGKLCILYGIDRRNDHHEQVLERLEELKTRYERKQFYLVNLPNHFNNNMIEMSGTHRKILIKDTELTIKGSFNYLSNNASSNEKFAAEEATVFYEGAKERWKQIFSEYELADKWLDFI